MTGKVTNQDIAQHVGVSTMTVSNALRGTGKMKEATRREIFRTAQQLGHNRARAVVFPSVHSRGVPGPALRLIMPLFTERARLTKQDYQHGILASVSKRLTECGGGIDTVEIDNIQHLRRCYREQRADGIVLREFVPRRMIEQCQRIGPTVAIHCGYVSNAVDCLTINEHHGAAALTDHLWARGHRRIAWLGSMQSAKMNGCYGDLSHTEAIYLASGSQTVRHAAWAHLVHCQPMNQQMSLNILEHKSDESIESVIDRGLDWLLNLEPRPTAVVTPDDQFGYRLIDQAKGRGVHTPRDWSVVGYGGAALNGRQDMTTILMPWEKIGAAIPEVIERRRASPDREPILLMFQTTLREGKTVATIQGESS